EVGQRAGEVLAGRAAAEAERGVGVYGAVERVGGGGGFRKAAVDVNANAGGLAGAVVGHRNVGPRAVLEARVRVHLDRVLGPTVNEVDGELAIFGDECIDAAMLLGVVHAAKKGAAAFGTGPDGERERT